MKLSQTEIEAIQHEMTLYEDPGAATIEALKIVQEHRGWVSDESLEAAAAVVGVTPTQMEAVATFYNLIFRQPVGRHVIMICDSISCYLTGYEEILRLFEEDAGHRVRPDHAGQSLHAAADLLPGQLRQRPGHAYQHRLSRPAHAR